MFRTCFFFWLSSALIVTQNFGLSRGIVVEKWIEQNQDHFDSDNGKTWLMRYYENDEFYRQSGPIFITIGGKYAITPNFIKDNSSFIYTLAEAHGAMMYNTEHRYYGKSHPVPDTGLQNLKYLSISQALADTALFIEKKTQELNISNTLIIVFGEHYAGNLAAWMRVEYPNLVHGALTISAPIYVKFDFFEFYHFVEKSIHEHDENCAINIKKAFSALEKLLKNPGINSIIISRDFKFCHYIDFSQPSEAAYLILSLVNIISDIVSYNKIEINGKTSIENICILMKKYESSYYGLAEMFEAKFLGNNHCINLTNEGMMEELRQTSWESWRVEERVWLYQLCTELGYHRRLLSANSIFGSLSPEKYFDDMCRNIFIAIYHPDYLNHNVKTINSLVNSKLSTTKNIIFVNGDLDPWRTLSVVSDLNADSPAILIDGVSHCAFLKENGATQTNSFTAARCRVFFMIYEWLHMYENLHGSLPMEITI